MPNARAGIWVTASLVFLTVIYSVLQVGFVRPRLPADPRPNLARPPVVSPILLAGGGVDAKVLDLGVAKLVEDRSRAATIDADPADPQATLTMAGTIVGTPAEMAPEQLRAGAPDARTDVFALGVIAYEMLAGDLPFSRGTLTDVVLAQSRGAAPLGRRDPAIPAPLDRAVMRAIALDAADRPRSAQALGGDLLASLSAMT